MTPKQGDQKICKDSAIEYRAADAYCVFRHIDAVVGNFLMDRQQSAGQIPEKERPYDQKEVLDHCQRKSGICLTH